MIQAGTMSTGSGRTSAVADAYWISSIKPVAIDDLPRRYGDVMADPERLGPRPRLRPAMARSQSSTKFCAPRMKFMPISVRVRSRTSGLVNNWFDGEKTSSHCRVPKVTMFSFFSLHATHVGHRVVPPLLPQQERLVDQVIRRSPPGPGKEPSVLRQRLDAWLATLAACSAPSRVTRQTGPFAGRLLDELELFPRRVCQMRRPICIRADQSHRRDAHREARQRGVQRTVENFRQSRRGVRIAQKCRGRDPSGAGLLRRAPSPRVGRSSVAIASPSPVAAQRPPRSMRDVLSS